MASGNRQGLLLLHTSKLQNWQVGPTEHTFQMPRKALLNSWVLPCRSSLFNPQYSSPYLRLWHIELSKSCQLNFKVFLTEINSFSPTPSASFTQERAWAEQKIKKNWNCSVVRRTETIWVAAVEFSIWCGSKSLVPFPVLTFLFSQYLMFIFKVIALEKSFWCFFFFP